MRTGYDLRTARRSMNLMCIEWQNRGLNLWTIDQKTKALVSGTGQYTLEADTIDLLDHVIRQNSGNTSTQSDLTISLQLKLIILKNLICSTIEINLIIPSCSFVLVKSVCL